ncbi:uncharacterized protein LOC132757989 [Ruditapes philippinarum]|uniref:uncharacterized protein LOC132757989 n=1 Tax=Ruditapes philippinarum TaxID=129788 RepID=UPI00295A81C3|nr:uncharacterized protein LOC132757989 [Ruditapes philippinarum]
MAREHRSVNWELQELRSAICKEISFMEAGIPTTDINNRETDVHIPTASSYTGTRQSTNERKNECKKEVKFRKTFKKVCTFCNDEHSPNECRKVTSYKSRIDIVKKEHLYFICLRKHQVSACRSTNRCRHCQRKYHSRTCDKSAKPSNSKLNPNAASFTIPATSSVSNQHEAAIPHSITQLGHNVFLKTAVAFDEVSQRSFITEEIAEKLQIEPTGSEVVHLASFGDTSQRPPVATQEPSTHLLNIITTSPDSSDIERFWKRESLDISQEEENPESTYLENYRHDSITYNNGRNTAKLPWK